MFDHVTIGASDRDASRRFYATVLGTLGIPPSTEDPSSTAWWDWSVEQAGPDRPVTRGLHVGFAAPSRERVDAFWRAGVDAGFRSDGEPGPRPEYSDGYYGAFLLDPDGNSAEAVVHGNLRRGRGTVDHLWIRVADLDASRRFYDTIAPHAGFRVVAEHEDRVRFSRGPHQGSFTLVAGPPTGPVHLAFGAPDRAAVDAFHAAATDAGYADHGAPGERPVHHAGSYGAFVLDPDGHDVAVVHHGR